MAIWSLLRWLVEGGRGEFFFPSLFFRRRGFCGAVALVPLLLCALHFRARLLAARSLCFSPPPRSSPLRSHLLEDVVDERVEDRHGLGRDARVGVDLLEDLVDVNLVRLVLGLGALLGAALGDLLGGLLGSSLGSHCWKLVLGWLGGEGD